MALTVGTLNFMGVFNINDGYVYTNNVNIPVVKYSGKNYVAIDQPNGENTPDLDPAWVLWEDQPVSVYNTYALLPSTNNISGTLAVVSTASASNQAGLYYYGTSWTFVGLIPDGLNLVVTNGTINLSAALQTKINSAVQPGQLSKVATSGSYTDLINTPVIPAAQVNSDWDATTGVAQILNKPVIPTSTDPVIDLVPSTLVSGEVFIAIFPIDKPANVSGAWQTKGEYIGSIFSPSSTTAQVSLIGFEVDVVYYNSSNVFVNLNYDMDKYRSNTQPSLLASLATLNVKAYTTTVNGVVYCALTYEQDSVAGFELQTQFDGNLTLDAGATQQAWIGQTKLNAPQPVTPIPMTNPLNRTTTGLLISYTSNEYNFGDYIAEQYSTTGFLVNKTWLDSNGTPTIVLPATTGTTGGGLGMKQINNYFIDVVSSNVTFTYQAIGGALTTVALTGIVNGDNLTDISYDGTNYWLCSEGGNIYSSPANATTPFQNWTLVFSAGINYPLFAIASAAGASGYTCAMGSGNYIVNNKSSTWQVNTPSFPINVRKINSAFFSLTGQCNILGTGTVSGTMVFAGVDSSGKGCYVATGGSSTSFLVYWCSGEIQFVNATVNQIIYANPTVGGWIMACNFENICSQAILGTGSITSNAPQGQLNQPYNSVSYDGTNIYIASSSGYMGYFKANVNLSNLWTAITIPNFVPTAVASEAVTPFATVFAGALSGSPAVAVSTTPATPSFTTQVIPLYLNLPYLFSDPYADKRLASRGYVSDTLPVAVLYNYVTAPTTTTAYTVTAPTVLSITSPLCQQFSYRVTCPTSSSVTLGQAATVDLNISINAPLNFVGDGFISLELPAGIIAAATTSLSFRLNLTSTSGQTVRYVRSNTATTNANRLFALTDYTGTNGSATVNSVMWQITALAGGILRVSAPTSANNAS